MASKNLLSVQQAWREYAGVMPCGQVLLYRAVRSGEINTVNIGLVRRIVRADLERWIAEKNGDLAAA